MIRVLVVDDSAFMRKAISMMLDGDPDIEVVGTARDGLDAIEKARQYAPDLITMDVEMPRLNGIEAVRRIMAEQPTPIIMISSLTRDGASATMDALQAGAVDFISKEQSFVSLEITKIRSELITKAKAIGRAKSNVSRIRELTTRPAAKKPSVEVPDVSFSRAQAVIIGISTGGPSALRSVIPQLPKDFPLPVFIVQHMPPHFTASLAARLDSLSPLHVKEVESGEVAQAGTVYIARGGHHMKLRRRGRDVVLETPMDPEMLHRPSVDVLFSSAVNVYGGNLLGVIMTGMGSDGLDGSRRLQQMGGRLMAQDEETSVVYGMPRAVAQAGLTDFVLPLDQLAPAIAKSIQKPASRLRVVRRRQRARL